jgi:hypothetical protein
LGIEVLNILQPIDPACISSKRTVAAEALLKHYPAEWLSYDKYKNIHEYVAAYASVEEGINFYHTDAEHDLDFWDIAHLSPAGEAQFSDWLMSLMFKVNFMGIAL